MCRLNKSVALCLLLAGCGSHAVPPQDPLPVRLAECWVLMESLGDPWAGWATYGRQLECEGRIRGRDLDAHVPPLHAGTDLVSGVVYVNWSTAMEMSTPHLVIVLLDEMAHLRYQTAGHEEFDRLHGQWVAAYEMRYGAFPGDRRD